MRILFIHSSYKPNDLIGNWFTYIRNHVRADGGNAWFAIKFRHSGQQPDDIMVGDSISCGIHARMFNYFGLQDMWSVGATRKFLHKLEELRPDIIHCHVINDCFLNMKIFADYVNRKNIQVVWTFHDARVLTGGCPYPFNVPCNQWIVSCKKCPVKNGFLAPKHSWINSIGFMHRYRKKTIGSIRNLTIATPSAWMKGLVRQSYLKDRRCQVIHNGINLAVFQPVEGNVRQKYDIPNDRKILLAVGNPLWQLKGRDYLFRLIEELPDFYHFILVGALERDLEQLNNHPNVLAFPRVDRDQLVEFYSAADLFVNPTLADNFPTVNLEAQACGCPVVAFDSDGTPETVASGGIVVPRQDYKALKEAILQFNYEGAREKAIVYAREFDQNLCVNQYLELYSNLYSHAH